jgi:hypothetical protein
MQLRQRCCCCEAVLVLLLVPALLVFLHLLLPSFCFSGCFVAT